MSIGKASQSLSNLPAKRQAKLLFKRKLLHAAHVMGPTLLALAFAGVGSGVAHAQGTMDFSGAQTLMGTFKTFAAFLRRADEGTPSRLLVETTILVAASRTNTATVLRYAATTYRVNTDAIALKVKQEFASHERQREKRRLHLKPQRMRHSSSSLPLLLS